MQWEHREEGCSAQAKESEMTCQSFWVFLLFSDYPLSHDGHSLFLNVRLEVRAVKCPPLGTSPVC